LKDGEIIMAKILIVDDSKTSRRFLRDMLEEAGHEIVGEAVNGQEGVDKYFELKPDVVTMDITMPQKDGIEAVADIVAGDPDAKVIMVTAAGQKTNMIEALKRGASDFIQKPFDESVILDVIKKVIEE
jgi:two-component system chemotaxis response regulator CheY